MELTITTDQVKQLREKTGSGIMECRNALMKSKGDMELAVTLLREKAQGSRKTRRKNRRSG